jgi:hypothetical protein
MSRYKELVELLIFDDYQYRHLLAKAGHKCICGNNMRKGIDHSEKLEYVISVLCPKCVRGPYASESEDAGTTSEIMFPLIQSTNYKWSNKMTDKKITIISKSNNLNQRILEVNAELSKWLTAQGDGYDCEQDMLRLTTYEKQKESYIYQYEILKGENLYHIPRQRGDFDENDTKVQEWLLTPLDNQDVADGFYC